jgi:glyoxylase I family protein
MIAEKEAMRLGTNEKIGGGGFHHVALRAHDFEATVKFYTEGLGFKERHSWGEGDKRIVLLDSGDGNYMEVFAGGSNEPKPDGSYFHVAFRSNNIEAAVEAAVAAGAVVTVEPKDVVLGNNPPTPVRIAFVKGINGEVIEFFQSTGENQL